MSSSDFPNRRDLRLERFGDRDGVNRPAPLGDMAHVAAEHGGPAAGTRQTQAEREALCDAVFLTAGAVEWLRGLRSAVSAWLAGKEKDSPDRPTVASDATRLPGPDLGLGRTA